MGITETINEAWGWKGIEAVAVIDTNPFGNVIVRTVSGHFWRICPEELSVTQLANSQAAFDDVRSEPEFVRDWKMALLVQEARGLLGDPGEGRCYCLKIPAVMSGEYGGSNLATITLSELLSASGSLAKQIKDIPDGSKVRLVVK